MLGDGKMSFFRKSLGVIGEEAALSFLIKEGYRVLERNYRCRLGEIDIIAEDGEAIAFIEVKTRSNILFGAPQEAVNLKKQKKIRQIAQYFLLSHGLEERTVRFDVITVLYSKADGFVIEHLKGVF
ncbi:MAG: YraN family protein [Thermacetogeniaceae bacterium]